MDELERVSGCGCVPGSSEDGWSERRSPACLAEEQRVWAECLARGRNLVARVAGDREPEPRQK